MNYKDLYNYLRLHKDSPKKGSTAHWYPAFQTGFWYYWKENEGRELILCIPQTARCPDDTQSLFGEIIDWAWNLLYIPIVGIHGGFLLQALRMWREAKQLVTRYRPSTITIVGFSQGAAVGSILTMLFTTAGLPVRGITYAGPRVFGWLWWFVLKAMRVNIHRVVYGGDVVPRMPPFVFGFAHAGRRVAVERTLLPRFGDHQPTRYLKALDSATEKDY